MIQKDGMIRSGETVISAVDNAVAVVSVEDKVCILYIKNVSECRYKNRILTHLF